MRKFFWLIFFFFLFFLTFKLSLAEELPKTTKVDYTLPYPGLLPDSPLYFLKVTRDRIIGFLISDPLKKAEFDLLSADKRLNAGVYLFNRGKANLSQSTVSKGENYFEEAIVKTREAGKQGMDTSDILRRLLQSSKKHQEILKELQFPALEKRAIDFTKQVESLTLK